MKHLDKLLLMTIVTILVAGCVEEGDNLYTYQYIESPHTTTYGNVYTNSITFTNTNNYYGDLMIAENRDMKDGKVMPTGGRVEFRHLRPATTYYFAYVKTDDYGGKFTGSVQNYTTADYNSTISKTGPTQVTFSMGSVEYEKLLFSKTSDMYGAVKAELRDDNEIWYLQPATTYYWATEATDLFGHTYRSPAKQFTTRDYNMYIETISKNSAIFNAADVFYTRLLLSDRSDMSNILTEGTSRQRTLISGLKSSTTYYVQTEATDLFGTVYRSPVYPFTTRAFSIVTQQPEVTSATARLKATIDGDVTGLYPTVRFEVYANGSYIISQQAELETGSQNNYICDIAILPNNTSYTVKAVAYVNGSTYTQGEQVAFTLDSHHAAEAIDMGLSVKWASWNVGARSPEEYGGLYYYGDTNGNANAPSMYTDQYSISGTYRDIAHIAWGGTWRMPTFAELQELESHCTVEPTTMKGVAGYRLVSTVNGNSIFIPAAGTRANYERVASANRGVIAQIYSGTAPNNYRYVEDLYGNPHYGLYQVWCYYLTGSYMSYDIGINNYQIGRSIRPVRP